DGWDSQFAPDGLADEEAAGLERHVPHEPEVLAVDVGGCAEADALVAHRGGAATVEVDLQGDGLGGVPHGEVTDQLPGVVVQWPHFGRREGNGGVVLDVEEVRALEVGISVVVATAQAGDVDPHFGVRLLRVFGDRDLTAHVVEPAAYLGDHEVTAHELDGRVGAVNVVNAGDGDEPIVTGPEHTDCSIRHRDHLLRFADVTTISADGCHVNKKSGRVC